MKSKILSALVAALVLLPAGASFAFTEGGGAFILAPRIFTGNDVYAYGPLRERYSGSASKLVQVELARLGYYHGPIDGNTKPGSMTAAAIAWYQRNHRLPVTGAIDGGLIASLNGQ